MTNLQLSQALDTLAEQAQQQALSLTHWAGVANGVDGGGVQIDVPWQGQRSEGSWQYSKDCGHACTNALVRWATWGNKQPSTNMVFVRSGTIPGQYGQFKHLIKALKHYKVAYEFYGSAAPNGPMDNATIQMLLEMGKPCMLLTWREWLDIEPDNPKRFKGFHFVVCTGYKANKFLILDPLMSDNRSGSIWIDADKVARAMVDYTGNLANQGLAITRWK